jgi:TPR repeat protein
VTFALARTKTMTTKERWRRDIRKWRPQAARGDGRALVNIAVAYRVLGRARLSAQWFKKAAMTDDGDAMVDYAYCLQHGAGVRRDLALAEELYRRAIGSYYICEAGREEAMYLLSVILLRNNSGISRCEALKLLRAANVDGDYPVAQRFLEAVASGRAGTACTCRRYLRPGLARVHCPLHRKRSGQPNGPANVGQPSPSESKATPPAAGRRR